MNTILALDHAYITAITENVYGTDAIDYIFDNIREEKKLDWWTDRRTRFRERIRELSEDPIFECSGSGLSLDELADR